MAVFKNGFKMYIAQLKDIQADYEIPDNDNISVMRRVEMSSMKQMMHQIKKGNEFYKNVFLHKHNLQLLT